MRISNFSCYRNMLWTNSNPILLCKYENLPLKNVAKPSLCSVIDNYVERIIIIWVAECTQFKAEPRSSRNHAVDEEQTQLFVISLPEWLYWSARGTLHFSTYTTCVTIALASQDYCSTCYVNCIAAGKAGWAILPREPFWHSTGVVQIVWLKFTQQSISTLVHLLYRMTQQKFSISGAHRISLAEWLLTIR